MTKPERAARLWLAVAVATLWLRRVGGEVDETIPASTVPDITALVPTPRRMRRADGWSVSFARAGSASWSHCCIRRHCP